MFKGVLFQKSRQSISKAINKAEQWSQVKATDRNRQALYRTVNVLNEQVHELVSTETMHHKLYKIQSCGKAAIQKPFCLNQMSMHEDS